MCIQEYVPTSSFIYKYCVTSERRRVIESRFFCMFETWVCTLCNSWLIRSWPSWYIVDIWSWSWDTGRTTTRRRRREAGGPPKDEEHLHRYLYIFIHICIYMSEIWEFLAEHSLSRESTCRCGRAGVLARMRGRSQIHTCVHAQTCAYTHTPLWNIFLILLSPFTSPNSISHPLLHVRARTYTHVHANTHIFTCTDMHTHLRNVCLSILLGSFASNLISHPLPSSCARTHAQRAHKPTNIKYACTHPSTTHSVTRTHAHTHNTPNIQTHL